MVETPQNNESADSLDSSDLPRQILGSAFPTLKLFHDQLWHDGVERGVIGPHDRNIIWERHILNSAALVPFVRKTTGHHHSVTIADVGSGGGLPGIVLAACLPDCQLVLIEPMLRRVEWLNDVTASLHMRNVTIERFRAEDFRRSHVHSLFPVVTCRAVANMTKLASLALPLVAHHGYLLALKGRSAPLELRKAASVIARHHGVNPRVLVAPVGPGLEPTHLIAVERT